MPCSLTIIHHTHGTCDLWFSRVLSVQSRFPDASPPARPSARPPLLAAPDRSGQVYVSRRHPVGQHPARGQRCALAPCSRSSPRGRGPTRARTPVPRILLRVASRSSDATSSSDGSDRGGTAC